MRSEMRRSRVDDVRKITENEEERRRLRKRRHRENDSEKKKSGIIGWSHTAMSYL